MDCFPDYCLACDKQITEGLYCSQPCRLADLERAGSTPTSPLTPLSSSLASSPGNNATLQLAPAFDFSSRTFSTQMTPTSSASLSTTPAPRKPGCQHASSAPTTPYRSLTPCSSRSSLSSTGSSVRSRQLSDGLSEEAKHELKAYFDSFDSRERRRRSFPIPHQAPHASRGIPQGAMTPISSYDDEQ